MPSSEGGGGIMHVQTTGNDSGLLAGTSMRVHICVRCS